MKIMVYPKRTLYELAYLLNLELPVMFQIGHREAYFDVVREGEVQGKTSCRFKLELQLLSGSPFWTSVSSSEKCRW